MTFPVISVHSTIGLIGGDNVVTVNNQDAGYNYPHPSHGLSR